MKSIRKDFLRKRRLRLAAILLILCVVPQILLARPVTVEGVGYTRDGAIQAALRAAVEQTVGVRISSQTLIANFKVVTDKILSHADGFVSTYKVLTQTAEYGLVKVRVSADVAMGALEDSLAAQRLLYEIVNKPRIMVLLDERVDGAPASAKTGSRVFEKILVDRGFVVIDPQTLESIRVGQPQELAAVGFKNGADLIIRGEVAIDAPTPKLLYGVQFYTVPIQINAVVVRADNAQIVASRTASIKKNSQEAASAAHFGLESGGSALAQNVVADLIAYWQSTAFNENRVGLKILGATEKELSALETQVRGMHFVRNSRLRYIATGTALYDLDLRGTVQELRAAFSHEMGVGYTIEAFSAGTITLVKVNSSLATAPPPAEIADFFVEEIFPSRLRSYETNPPARLVFGNSARQTATISIFVPDFMTMAAEKRVSISRGDTIAFALLFDNERLLKNTETRSVYAKVSVAFGANGAGGVRTLTAPVTIYDKNAMDWSVPEAVAGFVTYRDPVVDELARAVLKTLLPEAKTNSDLLAGLALFETIRALKIKYVKDPASSPGTRLLDRVQYPSETLHKRGGDCDDLSVLYAAMLSAVGIPAAIIAYSDHVLVMFETGIFAKNRLAISNDSVHTVVHNGTLWVPVETTRLTGGFTAAWNVAATEFHEAIAQKSSVGIIDLTEAWKKYPPAPVIPSEKVGIPQNLDRSVISEIDTLGRFVGLGQSRSISVLEAEIAAMTPTDPRAAALLNRLGLLKIRAGNASAAVTCFEKCFAIKQSSAAASNLACARLISGDDAAAIKGLGAVYTKDPSGRIAVNRALVLFVRAVDVAGVDSFVVAMKAARAMMPSADSLARYLGIAIEATVETRATQGHEVQKAQNIDLRRLQEMIRTRVLSADITQNGRHSGTTTESSTGKRTSGTTTETSSGKLADNTTPVCMPFGGIRGADPEQVGKIIDLLYWFEEL
jgi:transglutaminase-like putative cysteine protease